MMTRKDVAEYVRDLFYVEEQVLAEIDACKLPKEIKNRLHDNVAEKQVILTKIIGILLQSL